MDIKIDPAMVPDLYRMIVRGKCLEPVFKDGADLLFSKSDPYTLGDFIVIYRRPDIVPPGQFPAIVKRLIMMPPHWVKFPWAANPESEIDEVFFVETQNPRQRFIQRCRHILAVHKCLGLTPDGDRDFPAMEPSP